MIHGPCERLNMGSPCMKDGSCKKKIQSIFFSSLQGNDCYPIYRKREDGRYVLVNRNYDVYVDNGWLFHIMHDCY